MRSQINVHLNWVVGKGKQQQSDTRNKKNSSEPTVGAYRNAWHIQHNIFEKPNEYEIIIKGAKS